MESQGAFRILQAARDLGADFAEIYREETRFGSLSLRDRKIESASAGTEFGIGVRLLFGTQVLYGHTSREDEDVLMSLVRDLAAARPGDRSDVRLVPPSDRVRPTGVHPVRFDPSSAEGDIRLAVLRTIDETARAVSGKVVQVSAGTTHKVSEIALWNSEGLHATDRRTWCRATVSVVASHGGERTIGTEAPGARQGFEFLHGLDAVGTARVAAERAVRMLDAAPPPAGEMPVILGNGFGGVIFHEACGHPLETEALRRKATPFAGKVGELVAHPCVTAVDDGTIPGAWGSLEVDDEGTPTQRTVLIENGILKQYLSDRVGATECGVPLTGSARRESYKYAPVARMRNTFIAAGESTLDQMLSAAEGGLYAVRMGGGSVNPATGEFNFSIEEAYRVEHGRVGAPVRGATLIGKGHEILPRIRMVGNDFQLAPGTCGASSGLVPVCVGQPTLLVDPILVGGRS
ncbi:MAG: TldD/PmbA family protein [Fibrobacteria bacterium]|nr:TldD/PmbA family protein [Fibrobacteria bacterium]